MKKHLTLILVVLLASTMSITINAKNDDPEGEPSMYAVNFQDDKGFVVVSASRKYYPILALVEQYDLQYNSSITNTLE